jgi:hypothetical protein
MTTLYASVDYILPVRGLRIWLLDLLGSILLPPSPPPVPRGVAGTEQCVAEPRWSSRTPAESRTRRLRPRPPRTGSRTEQREKELTGNDDIYWLLYRPALQPCCLKRLFMCLCIKTEIIRPQSDLGSLTTLSTLLLLCVSQHSQLNAIGQKKAPYHQLVIISDTHNEGRD